MGRRNRSALGCCTGPLLRVGQQDARVVRDELARRPVSNVDRDETGSGADQGPSQESGYQPFLSNSAMQFGFLTIPFIFIIHTDLVMMRILNIGLLFLLVAAPLAHAEQKIPIPIPTALSVSSKGDAGELLGAGWAYSRISSYNVTEAHASAVTIAAIHPTSLYSISIPGLHGINYKSIKLPSIPGVGLVMGAGVSVNGGSWHWVDVLAAAPMTDALKISVKPGDSVRTQSYAAVVRLGDISKGGTQVLSGLMEFVKVVSPDSFKNILSSWASYLALNTVNQTCTVDPVPTVEFGDVDSTTFKGKGTGSAEKPFHVSMNCPAGFNDVYYQLNPAGSSGVVDQIPGTISLNQDLVKGVGVQITSNDSASTPVQFGKNVRIQQYDSKSGNPRIELDFKARYIQTADQVTGGGTADAQAILTMSYD